jgi:hypothetical protein
VINKKFRKAPFTIIFWSWNMSRASVLLDSLA